MNGFLISRTLRDTNGNIEGNTTNRFTIGGYSYHISHKNCQIVHLADMILLVDGYFFPSSLNELKETITLQNFHELIHEKGHFCGVLITNSGMTFFNDVFGAKTIYWQQQGNKLLISSRAQLMPVYDLVIDPLAKFEILLYRFTTSSNTLLSAISKLKPKHTVQITGEKIQQQQQYWVLPKPKYSAVPLTEKIKKTKIALQNNLKVASKQYNKVAIFLSGGVDSSLLAALSKDIFEECCLITPVFKDEENPELATAKEFAKILGMKHYLVEISNESLLNDLQQLIKLNREPLRHYSSLAMTAMMREIPQDYQAVIYGEAADTLFGSNGIKRLETHLRWKKQCSYIPKSILSLGEKFLPGRVKVFKYLKSTSLQTLFLNLFRIHYTSTEQEIIDKLQDNNCYTVDSWSSIKNSSLSDIRYQAQNLFIDCDMPIHFKEAELIAGLYDKHFISPFFDADVIEISSTLSNDDFYGSDYVKPVLRELASEYFPRELIYQKKRGFPVPFISWLNNPLQALVIEAVAEEFLFSKEQIGKLTVEHNYESYWLLINWHLAQKNNNDCLDKNQQTATNNIDRHVI
ncbi:MAG: asparagine synthase (glutamine-hydrolyzing) [Colwellia sp.]|jgi:asparagine synthase (glutamine-hydrolysing)